LIAVVGEAIGNLCDFAEGIGAHACQALNMTLCTQMDDGLETYGYNSRQHAKFL
jgi:hypothetical protein